MRQGAIVGKLVDYREQETNFGLCAFEEVKTLCRRILGDFMVSLYLRYPAGQYPAGKSSMLARLMRQVQKGETIEITRERDRGRAHAYTVEVIE